MTYYSKGEGIIFFIIAILLFVGVFSIEYSYYIILRWIVFIAGIFVCFDSVSRWGRLPLVQLAICVIFNPIIPFYMDKGIWVIIDIISGIYFLSLWSNSNK